MMITKQYNNLKIEHYLLAFLIVSSLQFTDLKLFNVKLGDSFSIALILYFLINVKIKLPKLIKTLFYVFTFLLFTSFLVLIWVKIYSIPNVGFLKKVGFVSLSRYIQNIGCVYFAGYIFHFFRKHNYTFNKKFIVLIDKFMFAFGVFFAAFYLLSLLGLESKFVYGNNRLRGGYVEGGPFALFYMFYVIFRTIVLGNNKNWFVLSFIIIIMAQSKSSILFVLFYMIINALVLNKIKISRLILLSTAGIILLVFANFYFNFSNGIQGYIKEYLNVEEVVANRPNDPSLVMGRIAGAYISPNIIKDNWFLGVGLGNYSLVRNNPSYRGPFPAVRGWDLTGLGGIINILIESGFLGLLLFLYPFYFLFKRTKNLEVKQGIIIFILAQVFGVQSYFQYLWFCIGIICYLEYQEGFISFLKEKQIDKVINNELNG